MPVLARDGGRRHPRRRVPPGRDRRQAARPGRRSSSSRPTSWPAARSRSARRSSSARCCSSGSGCPPTARARPATRPTPRVLAKIRDLHPIIDVVERWREQSKLLTTYLVPLPGLVDPADGRLHTTFSQTTAATGRLSLDRPEPAEHPDPHAARAARSAARSSPGPAACCCRPTTRRSSCGSSPTCPASRRCADAFAARRGHPPRDRRRGARQAGRGADRDRAQPRQGRQLRHHLRHQRVRPVRAAGHLAGGGAELHRHLPGPLPAGQRVHAQRDRRRPRRTAT